MINEVTQEELISFLEEQELLQKNNNNTNQHVENIIDLPVNSNIDTEFQPQITTEKRKRKQKSLNTVSDVMRIRPSNLQTKSKKKLQQMKEKEEEEIRRQQQLEQEKEKEKKEQQKKKIVVKISMGRRVQKSDIKKTSIIATPLTTKTQRRGCESCVLTKLFYETSPHSNVDATRKCVFSLLCKISAKNREQWDREIPAHLSSCLFKPNQNRGEEEEENCPKRTDVLSLVIIGMIIEKDFKDFMLLGFESEFIKSPEWSNDSDILYLKYAFQPNLFLNSSKIAAFLNSPMLQELFDDFKFGIITSTELFLVKSVAIFMWTPAITMPLFPPPSFDLFLRNNKKIIK